MNYIKLKFVTFVTALLLLAFVTIITIDTTVTLVSSHSYNGLCTLEAAELFLI